jgi:monoamine oxidase
LAGAFGVEVSVLKEMLGGCFAHDWRQDEWALGAYSYVPVGSVDVPRALGESVEDTVYFAGEHTDVTGHWGTVHAALRSGWRVAGEILGD